jgi:hypothetical protein
VRDLERHEDRRLELALDASGPDLASRLQALVGTAA